MFDPPRRLENAVQLGLKARVTPGQRPKRGSNIVPSPPPMLSKPRQSIDSLGLDSLDRGYSTDGFVERSDLSYPGGFRASHEVGVGKIKPLAFVQGNRSQE